MSASHKIYLQGETASFEVADGGYAAATLHIGGADNALQHEMTLSGGKWSATISTAELSGGFRFAIFADGKLVEEGAFSVRVLVSKYRKTVAAIDATIQEIAIAGTANATLSAGGGSQSYTRADTDKLQKLRAMYLNMAVAEERGESPDNSPRPIREDMFL